jgi:hypothetical protein
MSHRLSSVATLALICVGFVDFVQVCSQADLPRMHLCDRRTDRPVCANMCVEDRFSRPHAKLKELSTLLRLPPGHFPLTSHRSTDTRFRGCY